MQLTCLRGIEERRQCESIDSSDEEQGDGRPATSSGAEHGFGKIQKGPVAE